MCRRELKLGQGRASRVESAAEFSKRKFCGQKCYRLFNRAAATVLGIHRTKCVVTTTMKEQARRLVLERLEKERAMRQKLPEENGVPVYRVPRGHGHDH